MLLNVLCASSKRLFGHIPYVMIQACMLNRKEYKVVFLSEVPVYVASISGHSTRKSTDGINKAFSTSPHDELFHFAKAAVSRLKIEMGEHAVVTDGLFRVDIFQKNDDKKSFVVNEFESLDANYDSNKETNEQCVRIFLEDYWLTKIDHSFKALA